MTSVSTIEKVNILSIDPYVATYQNVLSNDECANFINISKESLSRALVSTDKQGEISTGRTGYNYMDTT
jgi:hypothetical protein